MGNEGALPGRACKAKEPKELVSEIRPRTQAPATSAHQDKFRIPAAIVAMMATNAGIMCAFATIWVPNR